jgi:lysozyme
MSETTVAQVLAIATPQVTAAEGYRSVAYLDTRGVWTIGFGRTGPDVFRGVTTTLARETMLVNQKLAALCDDLSFHLPWWLNLSAPRAAVLLEMAYQLGVSGLLEFKQMLGAAQRGDFEAAANDDDLSAWAKQTPNREHHEAQQMLTGIAA